MDVDNIVVCQRLIDDNAPYHYAFRNRQGASNHGGRASLRTINQQNHHQFGGSGYGAAAVASSLSSHAHHGKGQQLRNSYLPDQRSGGNGASSFGGDITAAMVIPGIDGRDFDSPTSAALVPAVGNRFRLSLQ